MTHVDETDSNYADFASDYDTEVRAYCSYLHDCIFGMSYKAVSPGEKLLDIGIGTGLASETFNKAGLRITGIDNSPEMLEVCKKKQIAEALTSCDLSHGQLPFENRTFHHVICCGVLHFFGELAELFRETSRIVKPGGTFAFSIMPDDNQAGDYQREISDWDIPIYKHKPEYISQLLTENSFEQLKEQRLLTKDFHKRHYTLMFSVIVCRQK